MEIHIQKDGQRHGPFSEAQIRSGIDRGEFKRDDLAWTHGKASWQPLSALISLDVNQPPPISEQATEYNAVRPLDGNEPPDVALIHNTHQATSERANPVSVAIEDDNLSINGVSIQLPTDANPFNRFLGSPRWLENPPTYIWDDWGIKVQGNTRKSLGSVLLILQEPRLLGGVHNPRQAFLGNLTVGGVQITSETKIQDIVAKKHGAKLVENSTDSWENLEHTLFRSFFGGYNPSIWLCTNHDDTVAWLMFMHRKRKS